MSITKNERVQSVKQAQCASRARAIATPTPAGAVRCKQARALQANMQALPIMGSFDDFHEIGLELHATFPSGGSAVRIFRLQGCRLVGQSGLLYFVSLALRCSACFRFTAAQTTSTWNAAPEGSGRGTDASRAQHMLDTVLLRRVVT